MKSTFHHWECVKHCGACCRLDPAQREEALLALNEEQRSIYLEMVNSDGWCKYFDTGSRSCRIYDKRPDFCRVSSLLDLFDVSNDNLDNFAVNCCIQQIRSEYGGRSREIRRFKKAIMAKN